MVGDSVEFLKGEGLRVFFDAEHFFDGYKRNPEFALQVLEAAAVNGADCLVLCDTNGGSLPHEVETIVRDVVGHFDGIQIGMHTQNDTGCAVANAVAGVIGGATHVQGTVNGYGERTGNCDNTVLVPNLTLKMGIETVPRECLSRFTSVAHHVAELMNMPRRTSSPMWGPRLLLTRRACTPAPSRAGPTAMSTLIQRQSATAHASCWGTCPGARQWRLKAAELGIEIDKAAMSGVVDELKRLEHAGYHFEAADASLEMLLRRAAGQTFDFFQVESFKVLVERGREAEFDTEATLRIVVGGDRRVTVGEGDGPVNALDNAFRQAVRDDYPELDALRLTDYKVRVLDADRGTEAVTRVLIDSTDGETTWTTIGVSENIIESSWLALRDSVIYALMRHRLGDSPSQ